MRGGETVIGTKMHLRKKSTSTLGIKGEERAGRNREGYFSPDREKRGTQTYKHTEEHSLSDLFAVTRATRTERERERERENKHERTNTDTDTDIRTHTSNRHSKTSDSLGVFLAVARTVFVCGGGLVAVQVAHCG